MRILLTNDDGVHAPGLKVLEEIARRFSDDIWIVAPSEEQSGAGHSLTLTRPLRIRQHGERHYSVTGTPTDAVMMAVGHLMKDARPDLILSGVNRGANLAEDVTYSGTVAAAMEGAISGIKSIALSQVYAREGMGDAVPFAAATAWGEQVLRPLIAMPASPRLLFNVNFPAIDPAAVKGIRVVRQGFHDVDRTRIVEGTDPRGYRYFWFGLGTSQSVPEGTDLAAIAEGYVTVTPLHYDLTQDSAMAATAALFD
ncbi:MULTISPECIES: 5'/3'-nucleotidase SurE [unclassified Sphingobium]|jgi:5'-nucleotidase|uniref:5'/3'-nucleotidase SurE n=1 Tax=unclassified Sphingobium TaxID=2611147 RepID=UPI0007F49495|nr:MULTISPECIES: 5'/3'-nucleotidase SurE [unclassified Sphingobium]OAN53577.1 5'/3'-nucleotidase SurE [Sphingobium sp. TCM1]WIW87209.1 5'/3'-nucleotidase SurE [Sphingobium sp. V4]